LTDTPSEDPEGLGVATPDNPQNATPLNFQNDTLPLLVDLTHDNVRYQSQVVLLGGGQAETRAAWSGAAA
jgi:hypothetical protein